MFLEEEKLLLLHRTIFPFEPDKNSGFLFVFINHAAAAAMQSFDRHTIIGIRLWPAGVGKYFAL